MSPEWLSTYNAALTGLLSQHNPNLTIYPRYNENEPKLKTREKYSEILKGYSALAAECADILHGKQL